MVKRLDRRLPWWQLGWLLEALIATFFIAGCAGISSGKAQNDSELPFWSGRLSISTTQPKPQRLSAAFELRGSPEAGSLTLTGPLGNTLAVAQWSPDRAVLEQGGQTVSQPDIQTLIAATLGQPLPLQAFFAWLQGRPEPAEGWTPDLTHWPEGRLVAHRHNPPGDTEVRIVLDAPPSR